MEQESIKEILLKEFKEDPLFNLVKTYNLETYLFPAQILSLKQNTRYSTVQVGEMLNRPDSTIRNHFRTDLVEYISPEKHGKYYRLDYKSVFRLHMIFLLMDKAARTTIDLLAELGKYPTIKIGEGSLKRLSPQRNSLTKQGADLLEKKVESIEKQMNLNTVMINIIKLEQDLKAIDDKISFKTFEIEKIKSDYHISFLEEKQSLLQTFQLRYRNKRSSLLGMFKKNNNQEEDELNEQLEKIKEKYKNNAKEKTDKIDSEIRELIREKEEKAKLLKREVQFLKEANTMKDENEIDTNILLDENAKY